ncbi:DUF1513 domain-containing protein [Pseudooceanicola sp. C21-150M6]|uniref:DUF1513 domain-containing protein n=1 Tax=Pseudooceanicola sp. C21-150M6 TaxID=3434355 RepID=UPI003D7FE5D6
MTTRRHFLAGLLAAGAAPRLSWADAGNPSYLAAAKEADGAYALYGLGGQGEEIFRIPLPGRGHAAAAHPFAPEAVAFARRPGTFALVIDCATGSVAHRLEAPEGHHFYGHGAFIEGGDILCTTENHIESGQGRIGLWSRRGGYRRIGEFATQGIGPHEVLALPGDVLAIANGGILTDPARGREKLNLDTMTPNLAYATADGVAEIVELDPELHRNSIRHLASDGTTVAFAMQWEGDLSEPVPLLGLHRRGAAPVLCEAGLAEQLAMDGYAGSVALAGGRVGITSPRGGRVHLFDLQGRFIESLRRTDVCGIAPAGQDMLATDGMGGILSLRGDALEPRRAASCAWDNHLVRVG